MPETTDEEALVLYCGPEGMDRRCKGLLADFEDRAIRLNHLPEDD
jgi:hypothetical protein